MPSSTTARCAVLREPRPRRKHELLCRSTRGRHRIAQLPRRSARRTRHRQARHLARLASALTAQGCLLGSCGTVPKEQCLKALSARVPLLGSHGASPRTSSASRCLYPTPPANVPARSPPLLRTSINPMRSIGAFVLPWVALTHRHQPRRLAASLRRHGSRGSFLPSFFLRVFVPWWSISAFVVHSAPLRFSTRPFRRRACATAWQPRRFAAAHKQCILVPLPYTTHACASLVVAGGPIARLSHVPQAQPAATAPQQFLFPSLSFPLLPFPSSCLCALVVSLPPSWFPHAFTPAV